MRSGVKRVVAYRKGRPGDGRTRTARSTVLRGTVRLRRLGAALLARCRASTPLMRARTALDTARVLCKREHESLPKAACALATQGAPGLQSAARQEAGRMCVIAAGEGGHTGVERCPGRRAAKRARSRGGAKRIASSHQSRAHTSHGQRPAARQNQVTQRPGPGPPRFPARDAHGAGARQPQPMPGAHGGRFQPGRSSRADRTEDKPASRLRLQVEVKPKISCAVSSGTSSCGQ
jgi:hypothetical protein